MPTQRVGFLRDVNKSGPAVGCLHRISYFCTATDKQTINRINNDI